MVPPATIALPFKLMLFVLVMAGNCWSVRWRRAFTVREANDT